jgi:hypothetical protein
MTQKFAYSARGFDIVSSTLNSVCETRRADIVYWKGQQRLLASSPGPHGGAAAHHVLSYAMVTMSTRPLTLCGSPTSPSPEASSASDASSRLFTPARMINKQEWSNVYSDRNTCCFEQGSQRNNVRFAEYANPHRSVPVSRIARRRSEMARINLGFTVGADHLAGERLCVELETAVDALPHVGSE